MDSDLVSRSIAAYLCQRAMLSFINEKSGELFVWCVSKRRTIDEAQDANIPISEARAKTTARWK
jgi:hypothetical protein